MTPPLSRSLQAYEILDLTDGYNRSLGVIMAWSAAHALTSAQELHPELQITDLMVRRTDQW